MADIILGIESSCDDTSAAVISDGYLLSNVLASQDVHKAYGGVIPELASRAHQVNIVPVVSEAITRAGIKPSDITAIAFTRGPGLLGSLLVGTSFAKGLAMSLDKPLVEVNHLQGHILANFIKQYDSEINRLGQDLQNSMATFQTQMQNGTIDSQQAYEKAEKNLANKQQNLENKRAQYAQNLMIEQENFNVALQDSLNNFIAEYNKSKKFDIILSKAGSNILYANPKMDITKEVIDGLNKRYKKK